MGLTSVIIECGGLPWGKVPGAGNKMGRSMTGHSMVGLQTEGETHVRGDGSCHGGRIHLEPLHVFQCTF
jgi:hypothetical protein